MPASYYPDFYHQVAWSADPNDPNGLEIYQDVTSMIRSIDKMPRGRQYELAQSRVEASEIVFRDPDEYLNPANTSSPLYPFVQPYRHMISQAVWPKAPGSGSNLLNLNNWRVPADGSFESYAVGTLPGFITQSNAATGPAVSTTTPFQGTQCLEYTVPTDAVNRYGIVYEVDCVPGQQYTTSAYVRQTSASTQIIRISDQVLVWDPFNRTTASGLGSASAPLGAGGAWSTTNGAAADRSTVAATPYAAGYASVNVTAAGTDWYQTIGSARDVRVRARLQVPAVATGAAIEAGVLARWTDASNHYAMSLVFATDQTVQLRLGKRVAGVFTSLAIYDLTGVYYQAGDEFYIDFYVTGQLLRGRAWRVGDAEPADLTASAQVTSSDTSLTGAGAVGTDFSRTAGNTNGTLGFRCYNFATEGAVEGSSTSATGAYNRISVTFTATAARHTVTVATVVGTTVAGTVSVDGLMHNTGAAAGTFASTGSTIYPVYSPYLERFPRTYEAAGFLGICTATGVDALAALASITLPSDYDYAVASLSPDFYWPLTGGADTTIYPDATGNNNPSLGLNISKFGIGTLPTGGTAMGIPGGGGATGVTFTPPSPATGSTLAATVLGAGPLSESPSTPFVLPASLTGTGGIWRVTVAMWVRATSSGASQTAFYPSKNVGSSAGQAYIPIYMDVNGSNGTAIQNVNAAGTPFILSSGGGLSGINILDGQPHLLVGIVIQDTAGSTTVYRYIDDQLDGANSALTSALGGALRGQTDSLSVGATDDGATFLAVVNGSISRLAVWNRELSPFETSALLTAGQGHPGETSGERVIRHFESGGFQGPYRVDSTRRQSNYSVGDPVTTMQAPSWSGSMDLLTDTQNTMSAEQGTLWVAPDGYVSTEGREERFLRTTSTWTLGEDTAAGEIPYGGDIGFDFDPTFVYGDVSVSRPGGATATGGLAVDVAATRRRYFPRSFGLSADFETDEQAQDCADFIFYSHRAPNMRVETVVIDPVSNPALWHFALSVEIGHRVNVKRRAKAANGGAGLTMSADYFVENVTPQRYIPEQGTYVVELELSPIGSGPGATVQPWILENSTLSVLDSTTVLGF